MTSQDFSKGIDFTGINPATGADHNTLVDAAVPYDDGSGEGKGLTIVTKDTALDTPATPNSVITTKWKRYIWIRIPHSSATVKTPIAYAWNDANPSIGALLKWTNVGTDLTTVNSEIAALQSGLASFGATATDALLTANAANVLANTANTNAASALAAANTAEADLAGALSIANGAKATADAANTTATEALTAANAIKPITTALSPSGTAGQRIRTNDTHSAVEWYSEENNYALVYEEYDNGNDGPAGANNDQNDRTLNLIAQNMIPALSLSASKFVVVPVDGVYRIRARAPMTNTGIAHHVLALKRMSDGVVILSGTSTNHNTSANPCSSYAEVEGRITLDANDGFKLVHYIQGSATPITLGSAVGAGLKEKYALVEITRLR